jgi:hypothetical protein
MRLADILLAAFSFVGQLAASLQLILRLTARMGRC